MSKQKKWIIIVSILVVTYLISFFIPKSESSQVASTQVAAKTVDKPWEEKTVSEKTVWLEKYFKSPDDAGYQLLGMAEDGVKKQLQYPKEVDFDRKPTFNIAQIALADSGLIVIANTGTCKNAFGVKVGFKYQCMVTLTPTVRRIERITVNENK